MIVKNTGCLRMYNEQSTSANRVKNVIGNYSEKVDQNESRYIWVNATNHNRLLEIWSPSTGIVSTVLCPSNEDQGTVVKDNPRVAQWKTRSKCQSASHNDAKSNQLR